jgi:protein-S-isoprenylcysteine O-methyltransferase Ste14
MKANIVARHILGYVFGTALFFFAIPFGLVGLAALDPLPSEPFPAHAALRLIPSLPFLALGLFFVVWSNVFLFKIGKGGPADGFNIAISPRTKNLVVSGPYRLTRNPMVFGAFSTYIGLGILLLSPLVLGALVVCLGLSSLYLRCTEEKRLGKDFGDVYSAYRKNVPMIFPKL